MSLSYVMDKVGVAAAAICGVHCLATPFVLALMPALPLGEPVEMFFLGLSALLAVWTSVVAYRKHGSLRPAAQMGVGLAVLLSPHLLGLPHEIHPFTAAVGAVILIVTHRANMRHDCASHCHA